MAGGKDAAPDGKKPGSPTEELGELVACLAAAVALALLIKFTLVEVFVIPSGSMEPTLHGRPDGGDRVFCSRVNYYWRDPERWEIIVFKFPAAHARQLQRSFDEKNSGMNFIKRCAGLPGETVKIYGGDLWTRRGDAGDWTRQVKPDAVLRSLWIPVYHEDFSALKLAEFDKFWAESGDGEAEIAPAGYLTVHASPGAERHFRFQPLVRNDLDDFAVSASPTKVLPGIPDRYVLRQDATFKCKSCGGEFRRTVWDQKLACRCPRCGAYALEDGIVNYGRRCDLPGRGGSGDTHISQGESDTLRRYNYRIVPDLRVKFLARLARGAELAVRLYSDNDHALARIAADHASFDFFEGAKNAYRNAETPYLKPLALDPAQWHEIEFYAADGTARLFVDNDETPVYSVPFRPLAAAPIDLPCGGGATSRSGVGFSVSGGAVDLDDLSLGRDIYYFSEYDPRKPFNAEAEFAVQDDCFLALGDNCPSSSDSRDWDSVPRKNLVGPALFVWWPPRRMHWLVRPFGVRMTWGLGAALGLGALCCWLTARRFWPRRRKKVEEKPVTGDTGKGTG